MGINYFVSKTEDIAFYFIHQLCNVFFGGGRVYTFNKAECKFASELLI